MTKAELTTEITGFANGGLNTAAEFRTFATNLLNQAYSDVYVEKNPDPDSENIITATISGGKRYQLTMASQGRVVTASGILQNKTGATTTDENWFTLNDGYKSHELIQYCWGFTSSGTPIRCDITATGIFKIFSALPDNQTVYINFSYIKKD